MQANFARWVSTANVLLREISDAKTSDDKLSNTMLLANHVLSLITNEPLREPSDIVGENILTLQNSERYDAWFQPHPFFEGTRAVFDLFEGVNPGIQAKLYWLKKRSNALMAGAVHFTPNWEDAEWSRNDNYKVGIDFFLSPDGSAMHVVLSNLGKLRVLELRGRLTNTDVEVLEKWFQVADDASKIELHTAVWESFKLHSVNAKFYRGVASAFSELHQHLVGLGKTDNDAKLFSSRLLGRLIFVWFMRKMSLINKDVDYFEPYGKDAGTYYSEKLERLFFRTFNTPVNERPLELDRSVDLLTPYLSGSLFEPRQDDWVGQGLTFPDDYFVRLYDHFADFNFTTDESTADYEQVAIDPEMLGRVFESLLATQVESTGEQARKAKGAFYTPREIVSFMCLNAVKRFLQDHDPDDDRWQSAVTKLVDTPDQEWSKSISNNLADIPTAVRERLEEKLKNLRSIDPACGSGAFPLGMLQLLYSLRIRLNPKLNAYDLKLSILKNNIFGSDIEPMAVEISRLRSWLSLIIEADSSRKVEPLPNLEFNFVAANSLIPLEGESLLGDRDFPEKLKKLRDDYFNANTPNAKRNLQVQYQKLIEPNLFDGFDARALQLKSFNPFSQQSVANFFDPEHMFGLSGGFDLVLGNPPYLGEKGHGDIFEPVRSSGLGVRFYVGKMDYFYFFFHLGLDLLKKGGVLCYITTNYYLTAKYANKLRDDMAKRSSPLLMLNFADLKIFESAAGQHNLITLLAKTDTNHPAKTVITKTEKVTKATSENLHAVFREDPDYVSVQEIPKNDLFSGGQIRLTNSDSHEIEAVLDKMATAGLSLGVHFNALTGAQTQADKVSKAHAKKFKLPDSDVGQGIFVITKKELDSLELDDHEMEIVKPWFKNSDIKRFLANSRNEEFVLYADKRAQSLESRTKIAKHLDKYREIIDAASSNSPYMHRPRSIDFDAPKLVTPYKTPEVRFAMTSGPWYASGDVYFIVPRTGEISLWALLGILNSDLINAWYWHRGKRKGNLIEMYEGPLSSTPLPIVSSANRENFAAIGALAKEITVAMSNHPDAEVSVLEVELNSRVAELYSLTKDQVQILESWSNMFSKGLL